jgi:hypothetical protein
VPALHDSPRDACGVDRRIGRSDEEQSNEEPDVDGAPNEIHLVGPGEHGFECQAALFREARFSASFSFGDRFSDRLRRVPVPELIARDEVGVYVFAVREPCVRKAAVRDRGLARAIRSRNDSRAAADRCQSSWSRFAGRSRSGTRSSDSELNLAP